MHQILIQNPFNIGKVDRMIYDSTINVAPNKGYSNIEVVYYKFLKKMLRSFLF